MCEVCQNSKMNRRFSVDNHISATQLRIVEYIISNVDKLLSDFYYLIVYDFPPLQMVVVVGISIPLF